MINTALGVTKKGKELRNESSFQIQKQMEVQEGLQ
jgi:hypothetical protein